MVRLSGAVVAVTVALIAFAAYGQSRASGNDAGSAATDAATTTLKIPETFLTAVVVTAEGKSMSAPTVLLKHNGQSFRISVAPGETTVIPFQPGWKLKAGEAAIEVARKNVDSPVQVWGVTPQGPVAFE